MAGRYDPDVLGDDSGRTGEETPAASPQHLTAEPRRRGRPPGLPTLSTGGSFSPSLRWAQQTPRAAARSNALAGGSFSSRPPSPGPSASAVLDCSCALLLLAAGCVPAAARPEPGLAACAALMCYDSRGGMRFPGGGGSAAVVLAGISGALCTASAAICAARAALRCCRKGPTPLGGRGIVAAAASFTAMAAAAAAAAAGASGAAPLPGVLLLWAPLGGLLICFRSASAHGHFAEAGTAAAQVQIVTPHEVALGEVPRELGSTARRGSVRTTGTAAATRVSAVGIEVSSQSSAEQEVVTPHAIAPPTERAGCLRPSFGAPPQCVSICSDEFPTVSSLPPHEPPPPPPGSKQGSAVLCDPPTPSPSRQSSSAPTRRGSGHAGQLVLSGPPSGASGDDVSHGTHPRTRSAEEGGELAVGRQHSSGTEAELERNLWALSGSPRASASGLVSAVAANQRRPSLPPLRLGAQLQPQQLQQSASPGGLEPAEPGESAPERTASGGSAQPACDIRDRQGTGTTSDSSCAAGRRNMQILRTTAQAATAVTKMRRAVRFSDLSNTRGSRDSPRKTLRPDPLPTAAVAPAVGDDTGNAKPFVPEGVQIAGDDGSGSDKEDPHGTTQRTLPARGSLCLSPPHSPSYSPCSSPVRHARGPCALSAGRLVTMRGRSASAMSFASTALPRNASLFTVRTTWEQDDDSGSVAAGAIREGSHVRETNRIVKSVSAAGVKIINGYEVMSELGRGSFSKVKLCSDQRTGELRALKIVKQSMCKSIGRIGGRASAMVGGIAKVRQEISIMKKVRHRNLIALHEVFDDPDADKIILVLDYAAQGPVGHIDQVTGQLLVPADPLRDEKMRPVLRDVINGLRYLHHRRVLHRDVKPENILLDAGGMAKLSDFGACMVLRQAPSADPNQGQVEMTDGTPAYFSPEAMTGRAFCGFAADVWALGVTSYALSQGVLPFHSTDRRELRELITCSDPFDPPNPPVAIAPLLDLIARMLRKDPTQRITLRDAMHHPFLSVISPIPTSSSGHEGVEVGWSHSVLGSPAQGHGTACTPLAGTSPAVFNARAPRGSTVFASPQDVNMSPDIASLLGPTLQELDASQRGPSLPPPAGRPDAPGGPRRSPIRPARAPASPAVSEDHRTSPTRVRASPVCPG
eukprot:TRINITY_DN174_c0_g2_i1.p1 TRINITY_DN174_c0_g2~~TRINITY_DN174_c0_g2_i1.p1  ORF type:complete len:1171 (+),score=262.17 TRINITY_DN174_c0_g2_i1:72-3515(+)